MVAWWVVLAACGRSAIMTGPFFDSGFATASHTGGECVVFYDGPVFVTDGRVSCADDELSLLFHTEGWTVDARVFVEDTRGVAPFWSEEHTLESVAHDACGTWDELSQTLRPDVPRGEGAQDLSSSMSCAAADRGLLTVAVAVSDDAGGLADCVITGHDPHAMLAHAGQRAIEPSWDLTACVVDPSLPEP